MTKIAAVSVVVKPACGWPLDRGPICLQWSDVPIRARLVGKPRVWRPFLLPLLADWETLVAGSGVAKPLRGLPLGAKRIR